MLERVKRALTSPDHYKIIRTGKGVQNSDREIVEDQLNAPPDPELWKLENSHQRPGTYVCQAIRGGFAEVAWSVTIGDPQEAREIDEVKAELEAMRDDLAGDRGGVMDNLPGAVLQSVLAGQLSVQEAKSIAELHRVFEGDESGSGLADQVDDPTNLSEISGAAVLEILDDPGRLEELSSAAGRAAGSAMVGAAQSGQQVPQREPQRPQPEQTQLDLQDAATAGADGAAQAATDGGEPEGVEIPKSPAKEAFEEAQEEADEDEDDEEAEDEGGEDDGE